MKWESEWDGGLFWGGGVVRSIDERQPLFMECFIMVHK